MPRRGCAALGCRRALARVYGVCTGVVDGGQAGRGRDVGGGLNDIDVDGLGDQQGLAVGLLDDDLRR